MNEDIKVPIHNSNLFYFFLPFLFVLFWFCFLHLAQSPVHAHRTDSLKRRIVANASPIPGEVPAQSIIPNYPFNASMLVQTSISLPNSPKMVPSMRNVASHLPSPKGSPLRKANNPGSNQNSPKRQVASEEQWVDGPRLSKLKIAEARHLMREVNHVKQCETWIDGPKMSPAKTLVMGCLPASTNQSGYGYMDNHKKSMIRQWVENQTNQVCQTANANDSIVNNVSAVIPRQMTQFKTYPSDDEEICIETTLIDIVNPLSEGLEHTSNRISEISLHLGQRQHSDIEAERIEVGSQRSAVTSSKQNDCQEDEDQDSGPSEVPPALPLIEPLGSREISHDSLHIMCSRHVSRESMPSHIQMMDCGLQVTEDEIARTMGR